MRVAGCWRGRRGQGDAAAAASGNVAASAAGVAVVAAAATAGAAATADLSRVLRWPRGSNSRHRRCLTGLRGAGRRTRTPSLPASRRGQREATVAALPPARHNVRHTALCRRQQGGPGGRWLRAGQAGVGSTVRHCR